MKITKNIDVEIDITPKQMAGMFCEMDSSDQALFFNEIGSNVKRWEKPFRFQMAYVVDEKCLNDDGKNVLQVIGDYV